MPDQDDTQHAAPTYREAPADLEYKDTRGSQIGYAASPVPHANRTGSALTDRERELADAHGRHDANGTGIPEDDHKEAQFTGVTTESGGTQSSPTLGSTQSGGTVKRPAAKS
jgi:hypothetical protein